MKVFLITLFLTAVNVNLDLHGGHMASFSYKIDPGSIILEFQIENSIIEHFDLSDICSSYKATTALCIAEYIKSKTEFTIDKKSVLFELEESKIDDNYTKITMITQGDFSNNEQIVISNHCFYELDNHFENRIIVTSDVETKSYLLNEKKNKITINK